jgi:hypothetical protein
MQTKTFVSGLTITLLMLLSVCYGNDLDDGIPINDMPVSQFDNLDRDVNITFIKMRAKSQAKINGGEVNAEEAIVSKNPTGSIDSVVFGAGSTIRGNIYIIDESKGSKTLIVDQ